jgi:hypothetical protein
MGMYVVHLGTGHTLPSLTIRSATVAKYAYAAAQLIAAFDDNSRDPRKDKDAKFADCFVSVKAELRRWEDVHNRCEPYTMAMQVRLIALCNNQPANGLYCCLHDWFSTQLAAGGRRGEWAQPKYGHELSKPDLNKRGQPKAFLLHDLSFMGPGKRRLSRAYALLHQAEVTLTDLKYRTQKNGAHGEHILFSASPTTPDANVPRTWLRIVKRFLRLVGNTPDICLAVYCCASSGVVKYITTTEIQVVMRRLAADVYNLDPVKDAAILALWEAHSLRVGACIILRGLGFQAL